MRRLTFLPILLLIMAVLLAGCGTATPTATDTVTAVATETTVNSEPALELAGLNGETKTLTMDELKAMTVVEGWGGIKSSTGKITPPVKLKGVALEELCSLVGGLNETTAVSLVAKDGYAMTYSLSQLAPSGFTTYDPATGDEIKVDEPLTAIIAYEADGKPIDANSDGPLRLAVVTSKNSQVVDGHWAVKWIEKIELKNLAEEWSLMLHGAVKENMDRASFESCASPSCHGAKWTDSEGNEWTGVPLWWLAGAVDDETAHGTGAFNVALADQGYQVEVIAKDGFSASFDISALKHNNKLMVAHLMNGNPLGEEDFPLKVVGDGITKKEMVSQIGEIKLSLAPESSAATAEATEAASAEEPAAAGEAALEVTGAVDNVLSLSIADLKALGLEKATVEHPKKGAMDVSGVKLSSILDQAKVKSDAKTVVFVAADGYTSELPLADVVGCADCLVTIGDDGSLATAMPDMQGNAWAKNMVKIEFK